MHSNERKSLTVHQLETCLLHRLTGWSFPLPKTTKISEDYRQLCYKRILHNAIKVAARAHSNVVFCAFACGQSRFDCEYRTEKRYD